MIELEFDGPVAAARTADFIDLGSGRWRVWSQAVLRGAGFPVHMVAAISSQQISKAADDVLDAASPSVPAPSSPVTRRFATAFEDQAGALAHRLLAICQHDRFREAVLWQNPAAVDSLLDRFDPSSGRTSRQRKRETVIASYLQRYTTKNESIGFFGPVGWAQWGRDSTTSLQVGSSMVKDRQVYFENWAIDALRARIIADPGLRAQLVPRRTASTYVENTVAHRALGRAVPLTPQQCRVLDAVDGTRSVEDVITALGGPAPDVEEILAGLEALDVLRVDLGGPIEAYPERHLAARLERMHGPAARAVRDDLRRLVAARDAVARAAGDAAALQVALDALAGTFEQVTGHGATRLHGKTYAGRSVVYEDTRRDAELVLGTSVLDELAGPLDLILQSGRWLTGRLARAYRHRFDDLFEMRRARSGQDAVPLSALLALAARDFYTGDGLPPLAAQAASDLAARWARIVDVDGHDGPIHLQPHDIAEAVEREFADAGPAWTAARHHSPDIMIAASSAEAIDRGEYLLVLGELHLAFNTVESRALVEQHDDPAALLRMAEAAVGRRRFVPAAPREWGSTTSRTSPPSALVSERDVHWSPGPDDDSHLPGGSVPVAALVVRRVDGQLVVAHRDGEVLADVVDFLGEHLSGVAVNCFTLLPRRKHTPRVTVGRLVVARESWRLPARECDWVNQMNEAARFLQMRAWRRRVGLPERAFYKVPTETKPCFVDFSSPALVNLLASHVRRLGPEQTVSISEMLPDLCDSWLEGEAGAVHTAELRMVVAEQDG